MHAKWGILAKKKKCWAIFKPFVKVNLNTLFLWLHLNMLIEIIAMQKTNIM